MELGNISSYMEEKNASAIRVPDLDWLVLTADDSKNIPTPHDVEIVPQLQETWGNTDQAAASLITNKIKSETGSSSEKIASTDIADVVNAAKKEMMLGTNGKELASRLAATYPRNLVAAAKPELLKLAAEQGLLGGVYVDLSPFDSCEHAARVLGRNKVRLASYVVGKPRRHVCSTHNQGHCKQLGKKVVEAVEYNSGLLSEYTKHLKVAGIIKGSDKISSKDNLRDALLQANMPKQAESSEVPAVEIERPEITASDFEEYKNSLVEDAKSETYASSDQFGEARNVLAYMQNEMLQGRIGTFLKEAVSKHIPADVIAKYEPQIRKMANLQGLVGNVYVDVSLYKDVDAAVHAIKSAKTSPAYVVASHVDGDFDDRLERVAAQTGCEIMTRDGKISSKVAQSHIDDLLHTSRISSSMADSARRKVEAGDNILGVLRDLWVGSVSHKPRTREGGVKAHFNQNFGRQPKTASRDKIQEAVSRAVEAGFGDDKIMDKMIQQIPAGEAKGMIRNVLASAKVVDANVVTQCARSMKDRYRFSHDATLKKADKCGSCIKATAEGCTALGLRFSTTEVPSSVLDPKTEKVLFNENPDVARQNINEEFDMPSFGGADINVQLDDMRQTEASGIDITFNREGLDSALADL